MSIRVSFESRTGEETLAAASLAKLCKGEPSLSLVAPPVGAADESSERVAEMTLWVAIINAAVGGIHLARFVYDVIQQRKVEISITGEDGQTYKIKANMPAEKIKRILSAKKPDV